jgi:hypothetical protein
MNNEEKRLNRAISQAKSKAKRKLNDIKAREGFSDSIIKHLDPTINKYVPHMDTSSKREFLNELRRFNSVKTDFYKDSAGLPITSAQWKDYKEVESRVNSFIESDINKYADRQMPIGELTVGQHNEILRGKPGVLPANPSGSGMFIYERKANEVNVSSLASLMNSLERKLDKNYKRDKGVEGRDQFEKMIGATGDRSLIQTARNLTDEQWWVLWNYTDFARQVSLEYVIMRDGMVKPSDNNIVNTTSEMINRHVEWASQI